MGCYGWTVSVTILRVSAIKMRISACNFDVECSLEPGAFVARNGMTIEVAGRELCHLHTRETYLQHLYCVYCNAIILYIVMYNVSRAQSVCRRCSLCVYYGPDKSSFLLQ